MANDTTEDKTLQKIEDLICYAIPQIEKMPRTERGISGLATKLRESLFSMAQRCLDVKKCFYAKSVLKELNELDKQLLYARFYIKTAYDLSFINYKRFEVMNDYLDQIGKMTGGRIKAVKETM